MTSLPELEAPPSKGVIFSEPDQPYDSLTFTAQFVAKEPWIFDEEGNPTRCLFRFMTSRALGFRKPYVALDIFLLIDRHDCFLTGLGGICLFDRPGDHWFDIFITPCNDDGSEMTDERLEVYRYISSTHSGRNYHEYRFETFYETKIPREGYLVSNRKLHLFDHMEDTLFTIQLKPHDWSDI